jgi:hypothetical protein
VSDTEQMIAQATEIKARRARVRRAFDGQTMDEDYYEMLEGCTTEDVADALEGRSLEEIADIILEFVHN